MDDNGWGSHTHTEQADSSWTKESLYRSAPFKISRQNESLAKGARPLPQLISQSVWEGFSRMGVEFVPPCNSLSGSIRLQASYRSALLYYVCVSLCCSQAFMPTSLACHSQQNAG